MEIKTNIQEISRAAWRNLVVSSSHGTIFQMPEMYDCYSKTVGHIPIVVALEDHGELIGVVLSVILQEVGFLKAYFSRRAVIIGGPIVKDDKKELVADLLKAYDEVISTKVLYTQIRNLYNQLPLNDAYQQNGYKFESHLNFLITLDHEEDMWKRIGQGRIKQIKKAQKNKLYVDVYENHQITTDLIEEGYSAIQNVYKRAKLPLANIDLIKNAQQHNLLVLFVVRDERGDLLGCRIGLKFQKTLYGWYAGSYQKYYGLYPNDILIWETLRWACQNGYKIFDYGGAGNPNKPYGVRNFKAQMGGELVNFGRYEKVHHKLLFGIAYIGFIVLRIFK